jgi:hypothetical protein
MINAPTKTRTTDLLFVKDKGGHAHKGLKLKQRRLTYSLSKTKVGMRTKASTKAKTTDLICFENKGGHERPQTKAKRLLT